MKDSEKNNKKLETPGDFLRFWRNINRISQMNLALDAGISPRHLSFVETGRSMPSRELILKLSQALNLPLRHRNVFLNTAGFSSEYSEEPLESANMTIIRQALKYMLDKHEPYPAFVINTSYKILMMNKGFEQFIHFYIGENALKKYNNAMMLLFADDGLKKHIKEWSGMEIFLLSRIWEEIILTQNSELIILYGEISSLKECKSFHPSKIESSLPVLSMTLEKNSIEASFFTTVTTLGTPLDLTAQELRIESLFPADERTKNMFPLY